jgi:hypothetical protein
VRRRGEGDLGSMDIADFASLVQGLVDSEINNN